MVFCFGRYFALAIAQGKVNWFRLIIIIVGSIGESALGASVLGVMVFFGVGGNFSILIAISQWIWEIGVGGSRILGGSIGGIRVSCVGVKCIFIINFIFPLFLVFCGGGGVGVKFAISQRIWGIGVSGSSILGIIIGGVSTGYVGGRGCLYFNFIINFLFLVFLGFYGVGGVGIKFSISRWIWEIGVGVSRILVGSIGFISVGCFRGVEGVKCNFIINFLFLIFLVFHCVGGVGGEFAISQWIW